jgi:hypothetical protein
MARQYIDSDEVRITRGAAYTLNLEFFDGRKFEEVEARSLFPISGPTRYITLLDKDGKEIAVIRNLNTIMPESREAVEDALREYYLIPKIIRILDRDEKYGVLKWTVETDRGIREFDIKNRQSDIKTVYGNRVLIRDANDNRYEIPDWEKLDIKSFKKIATDL